MAGAHEVWKCAHISMQVLTTESDSKQCSSTSSAPAKVVSSPSESDSDGWFTWQRFAGVLALLIFVAFPGVLLNASSFVYRDFGLFGYPLAHYHRECFWRGEVPLWNPLNNCGLPFLAQWNTLVCYPLSFIYLLLPLPWSLNLFCLLHLLLAGVTMYFLALRWTGHRLAAAMAGLTWACSGSVLSTLIWPNYIAVVAWLPAVILCCDRAWQEGGRWLMIAGLIGAMQMLAGTPELIMFTWLVVLALWADQFWRKQQPRGALVRRFATVVSLVAGLSAVQLLPFLDLLLHSHRSTEFGTGEYALPFSGLANYLVPLFRTIPSTSGVHFQPGQFCVSSLYGGIGVLGLAACALVQIRQRRVWLLGAMLLISVWLSLGDKGHLYGWLRQVFPGLNFMRYPVKFALAGAFLLPLLGAFGLREWTTRKPADRKPPLSRALVCTGLLLSCGVIVTIAFYRPLNETDWTVTLHSALSRLLFLTLISASLCGLIWFEEKKARLALSLCLLALFWCDGLTHAPSQNPTVSPSVYAPGLPMLEQMQPKPAVGQSRALISLPALDKFHEKSVPDPAANFLIRRVGLAYNCNLIDQLPKTDGFYALYLPHEREVHFRLYDADGAPRSNLADFLAVSQVTAKEDLLQWSARPGAMPMVTAGQQPLFLDPVTTLNHLMGETFNPRQTVLLPLEARPHLIASNRSDCRILSSRITAHSVLATVQAAETALVVISQVDYHWWKATVDGRAVPVWRANHAFQSVEVPAGTHEVQLVYRDRSFQAGVLVTFLTLLASAGLWRLAVARPKSTINAGEGFPVRWYSLSS